MEKPIKPGRITALACMLMLLVIVFVVALYKLQIVDGKAYYEENRNSVASSQTVAAARGSILDRYGRVLVSNTSCNNLVFNPDDLFEQDDPNGILLTFSCSGLMTSELFQKIVAGANWEPEFGYAAAMEVLEDRSITALLVANDRMAMGAYQAAQALGLAIPEDISIMSFDDEQLAEYLRPKVTTMRLPYLEMGKAGMDLLLQGIVPDGVGRAESVAAEKAGEGLGESHLARAEGGVARAEGEAGVGVGARESEPVLIPMPLVERGSVRHIR